MVELHELNENAVEEIVEDDNDDGFEDEEEVGENQQMTLDLSKDEQELAEDEDEEDYFLPDESILDRLAALVDIIPPKLRARIGNGVGSTVSLCRSGTGMLGSGLWVVATALLMVALPVSLELERDSMAIQQDHQMRASSQV